MLLLSLTATQLATLLVTACGSSPSHGRPYALPDPCSVVQAGDAEYVLGQAGKEARLPHTITTPTGIHVAGCGWVSSTGSSSVNVDVWGPPDASDFYAASLRVGRQSEAQFTHTTVIPGATKAFVRYAAVVFGYGSLVVSIFVTSYRGIDFRNEAAVALAPFAIRNLRALGPASRGG